MTVTETLYIQGFVFEKVSVESIGNLVAECSPAIPAAGVQFDLNGFKNDK